LFIKLKKKGPQGPFLLTPLHKYIMSTSPPYTNITGISRTVMKDNAQESIANYNGNARPGEMVVDLTNNDVYIGNTNGNLNLLVTGGGSGNSEPAGPVGAIQYNAGGTLFGGTANVTVSGTGIVVTGNVTAGNVVSNTMISNGSGNITFTGNIVPSANTFTLGTSTTPWADAFFGPESITILDESGNIGNSVVIQNIAANIVIGTTGFTINEFGTTNSIFRIEALTGQIFSAANTIITNTAQSSNVASGSLQTAGGAGIAKDLYVGGNITGNYFIGNGSQLTGITANTSNITSNVITFNTSAGISVSPGQMAWNSPDGTVDIGLSYDGVVLQVGQETHYVVRNATGNTLPNGTSVYCSGVTAGSGRMEASKFVADGSISPIQYLGLCTMDISNGVNGVVTYFGYVRGLDTRGTANTAISTGTDPGGWVEGTKLYAHPTVAGKLTSVEPTLPEQSICVAVVITRNQNSGVLFVRPTQTIPTSAGDLDNSISLSTLQTVTAASTDFADFQARIAALP